MEVYVKLTLYVECDEVRLSLDKITLYTRKYIVNL